MGKAAEIYFAAVRIFGGHLHSQRFVLSMLEKAPHVSFCWCWSHAVKFTLGPHHFGVRWCKRHVCGAFAGRVAVLALGISPL